MLNKQFLHLYHFTIILFRFVAVKYGQYMNLDVSEEIIFLHIISQCFECLFMFFSTFCRNKNVEKNNVEKF